MPTTRGSGTGHLVVLVGAGPAGLYLTAKLQADGHTVLILNRDIKPGGLAEYGIYFTKHKMKEGLRKQFRRILAPSQVLYFGNVAVGGGQAVRLEDLRRVGVSAIVVAAGAQGVKSLELPGEAGPCVYHAKDLVYHYNKLPPFSQQPFPTGKRVAVVGIGNVMVDVAHYLINVRQVDEVIAVARRGPAERAYDDLEMKVIAANIDQEALHRELERIRSRLKAVGQDTEVLFKELTKDCGVPAKDGPSPTRLTFRFLSSPIAVIRAPDGSLNALEVEETTLVEKEGRLSAKGLGEKSQIPVDTVIFAIGDRVDPSLGLPPGGTGYATAPPGANGVDPEMARYQAYDPETAAPIEGTFVVGWSRSASEGVVGKARVDGERGAAVINRFLANRPGRSLSEVYASIGSLYRQIEGDGRRVIPKGLWRLLESIERAEAGRRGLKEYKFATNEEMLDAMEAHLAPLTARQAKRLTGPQIPSHLLKAMRLYSACLPKGPGLTGEELAARTGMAELGSEEFTGILTQLEATGELVRLTTSPPRWRLARIP
ncbi:MAG: FAD-dependent oxidoreductase [Candidatus Methylomirabilales bacterium]